MSVLSRDSRITETLRDVFASQAHDASRMQLPTKVASSDDDTEGEVERRVAQTSSRSFATEVGRLGAFPSGIERGYCVIPRNVIPGRSNCRRAVELVTERVDVGSKCLAAWGHRPPAGHFTGKYSSSAGPHTYWPATIRRFTGEFVGLTDLPNETLSNFQEFEAIEETAPSLPFVLCADVVYAMDESEAKRLRLVWTGSDDGALQVASPNTSGGPSASSTGAFRLTPQSLPEVISIRNYAIAAAPQENDNGTNEHPRRSRRAAVALHNPAASSPIAGVDVVLERSYRTCVFTVLTVHTAETVSSAKKEALKDLHDRWRRARTTLPVMHPTVELNLPRDMSVSRRDPAARRFASSSVGINLDTPRLGSVAPTGHSGSATCACESVPRQSGSLSLLNLSGVAPVPPPERPVLPSAASDARSSQEAVPSPAAKSSHGMDRRRKPAQSDGIAVPRLQGTSIREAAGFGEPAVWDEPASRHAQADAAIISLRANSPQNHATRTSLDAARPLHPQGLQTVEAQNTGCALRSKSPTLFPHVSGVSQHDVSATMFDLSSVDHGSVKSSTHNVSRTQQQLAADTEDAHSDTPCKPTAVQQSPGGDSSVNGVAGSCEPQTVPIAEYMAMQQRISEMENALRLLMASKGGLQSSSFSTEPHLRETRGSEEEPFMEHATEEANEVIADARSSGASPPPVPRHEIPLPMQAAAAKAVPAAAAASAQRSARQRSPHAATPKPVYRSVTQTASAKTTVSLWRKAPQEVFPPNSYVFVDPESPLVPGSLSPPRSAAAPQQHKQRVLSPLYVPSTVRHIRGPTALSVDAHYHRQVSVRESQRRQQEEYERRHGTGYTNLDRQRAMHDILTRRDDRELGSSPVLQKKRTTIERAERQPSPRSSSAAASVDYSSGSRRESPTTRRRSTSSPTQTQERSDVFVRLTQSSSTSKRAYPPPPPPPQRISPVVPTMTKGIIVAIPERRSNDPRRSISPDFDVAASPEHDEHRSASQIVAMPTLLNAIVHS